MGLTLSLLAVEGNCQNQSYKSLQHRSGTSCLRWTVFKSQFYGFAAQKYSIKPQLKNCR
jgi:hypothetical protein